jgi:integrase
MPLRPIFKRAKRLGQVTVNPMDGLELPAVRGRRDRIATPEQAARMIEAMPAERRAPWALAFYSGPRLGEVRGLRWADIDFDAGIINIERSWCNRSAQMVEPKSRAGRRRVPMAGRLRQLLLEHRMQSAWSSDTDLVVTNRYGNPPSANTLANYRRAWKDLKGVPTDLGMHEARHTYASLMIAAGVGPKALCEFMGHSSITTTLDLYGHLFPGAHAEAALALDAYLDAQAGRS